MAATPACRTNISLPQKPPSARAALILTAGFLVLFLGGGARFAVGLTFKPIVEDLAWDRSQLGVAVAVFQIVSAACMYARSTAFMRVW